ncbi:uncharacterized protein LOC106091658 [Stomoxys calcitrans]|uniref:Uncharacterized protein n=1 Tax=Stomoxys calcitrans TaxID=35570 RepID=A0A1I8PWY0_STOCA|nr:uncharacterized protein LOC106091658 [Stomoxys calcitrans]
MSEYHRLTDQKYSEAEYLFQTIEMAKSDEEFDVELCSTPPSSHTELELELMANDPQSIYSWTLVKRRRPRRRYTVSHGGGGGAGGGAGTCQNGSGGAVQCNTSVGSLPPAPPSTPTSLTPTNTSLLSTSAANGSTDEPDNQRIDSLLYILDYAPKYKRKKLKEQQRTDAELAELFNVVSITASKGNSSASATSKMKVQPERGVAPMSRTIRKPLGTRAFKLNRRLKEFFETDEEDSVSAPEYDTEEEDTRFHRLGRIKPSGKLLQRKRQRKFARFEHQERMEAMVDIFDEAMNFNET